MNGQITQLIILCNGYGSIHIGDAGVCYPILGLVLSGIWRLYFWAVDIRSDVQVFGKASKVLTNKGMLSNTTLSNGND